MIIMQTIDIPVDRQLLLALPPELPVGKARVELKIIPENKQLKPKTESKVKNKSDLLLSPSLDTNGWKFNREAANER